MPHRSNAAFCCCTWKNHASIVAGVVGSRCFLEALERQAGAGSIIRFEINRVTEKKQGAAGITTTAPYVTGQWGRGDNRLPE
ncbi:hypothetical protein [Bradyrhizobium sp.]|uniref:hypothetical protein n=1 Tax=Bradyrhizobium sp. TaxID=376 RepID=UPI003C745E64